MAVQVLGGNGNGFNFLYPEGTPATSIPQSIFPDGPTQFAPGDLLLIVARGEPTAFGGGILQHPSDLTLQGRYDAHSILVFSKTVQASDIDSSGFVSTDVGWAFYNGAQDTALTLLFFVLRGADNANPLVDLASAASATDAPSITADPAGLNLLVLLFTALDTPAHPFYTINPRLTPDPDAMPQSASVNIGFGFHRPPNFHIGWSWYGDSVGSVFTPPTVDPNADLVTDDSGPSLISMSIRSAPPTGLVRLPNESHVAEVRAGASLRPSTRVA